MKFKINKGYKISATIHNTAGRLEKGLILTVFFVTGVKLLSAIAMDKFKTINKSTKR